MATHQKLTQQERQSVGKFLCVVDVSPLKRAKKSGFMSTVARNIERGPHGPPRSQKAIEKRAFATRYRFRSREG